MGWFRAIYIRALPSGEDALLAQSLRTAGKFVGKCHVRLRRGSGWLQLQPFDEGPSVGLIGGARSLSKEMASETISIESVTTVDSIEYTHWELGELRRHISYCAEDYEDDDGWGIDVGEPESWEKDWESNDTGPHAWDIGDSLQLPGFGPEMRDRSKKYWDVEETVPG